MNFKPLLAGSVGSLEDLNYPVLVSQKLDGIRCIVIDGIAYSRTMKRIQNIHISNALSELPLGTFDGELIVSSDFNKTQSAVMSVSGEPTFTYFVFDYVNGDFNKSFIERRGHLLSLDFDLPEFVTILQQYYAGSSEEIIKMFSDSEKMGWEGLMIRSPLGKYKQGRSTIKEGILLKLKKFHDTEGMVVGFEELMINANPPKKSEVGSQVRSQSKVGLIPSGTLGALIVSTDGIPFNIGTGFTDEQRSLLWEQRHAIIGKKVTYKYQELSKYGVPRFPVFKCFREDV